MAKWEIQEVGPVVNGKNFTIHITKIGSVKVYLYDIPDDKTRYSVAYCLATSSICAQLPKEYTDINNDDTLKEAKRKAIMQVRDVVYEQMSDLDDEVDSWRKRAKVTRKTS